MTFQHVILILQQPQYQPAIIRKEEAMAAKFVLKQSGKGKFRFALQAPNGQVILTSETYSSKEGAMNGIKSVRQNAGKDKNFEVRTGKSGQSYFVLRASNGEVIGQSEMYASARSVPRGMASVKKNASARTEDLTGK
jgi:uncharacterized protein YegP (UPF0339 family)